MTRNGFLLLAARLCPLCAQGVAHHTVSAASVSGGQRRIVWDLHEWITHGGYALSECWAGDLWLRAERKGWV